MLMNNIFFLVFVIELQSTTIYYYYASEGSEGILKTAKQVIIFHILIYTHTLTNSLIDPWISQRVTLVRQRTKSKLQLQKILLELDSDTQCHPRFPFWVIWGLCLFKVAIDPK